MIFRKFLMFASRGTTPKFTLEVKSDNAGTSGTNQFTIPTTTGTYLYDYTTSDGQSGTGITGDETITFASGAGTYEIYITGTFPYIYFDNGGDKLKLLRVLEWGDYGAGATTQSRAFYGCTNLSSIASDVDNLNLIILGDIMFLNCSSLTSLPSGLILGSLTNGREMFHDCSLSSLPSGMTLGLVTDGTNMFLNNSLTSLPSGLILGSLTNGTNMFLNNSLTSLPAAMTLPSLTNGREMFHNCSLSSLPASMTLPALTIGDTMFRDNLLTSLPSGMTLGLVTDGELMFFNNSLTSLPSGFTLASLTNGINMFNGNTIATADYSQLLVDLESGNPNNSVTFHGGSSLYNATGKVARDILTGGVRLWTITDGGLEP